MHIFFLIRQWETVYGEQLGLPSTPDSCSQAVCLTLSGDFSVHLQMHIFTRIQENSLFRLLTNGDIFWTVPHLGCWVFCFCFAVLRYIFILE